jgi:agmatinase
MRRVIDEGYVNGERFVQVGIRSYFPDPEDWDWMREVGMRWFTAEDFDHRDVISELLDIATTDFPDGVFISFDIDCFDPAFVPGTGSLEPGGLTPREVFPALRRLFNEVEVVGMELVEVAPNYDVSGITPLLAHRCILESLSALALRRSGKQLRSELPAEVR